MNMFGLHDASAVNMAVSRVMWRWCSSSSQKKATAWERFRNSRAVAWCESLSSDYKEACREVIVGARDRPLKASLYVGLLGAAWALHRTNPDEASFESHLLEMANKLVLLSPWIRSGPSDSHVQSLLRLRNQGRLRHIDLGVASVVYHAENHPDSSLYEARCTSLSPAWAQLPARVLDVGFAGRWWMLEGRMRDYDVNEEEFGHLPPTLRNTAPPNASETQRNQQLHVGSWKAPETRPEHVQ